MNEREWLESDDPGALLRALEDGERTATGMGPPAERVSDRKRRLFGAAVLALRDPGAAPLVAAVERFADGGDVRDLRRAWRLLAAPSGEAYPERPAEWVLGLLASKGGPPEAAALLRCVAGNPFRPVTLPKVPVACRQCGCGTLYGDVPTDDSEQSFWCKKCHQKQAWNPAWNRCPWLTPDAVAIAQAAYDERDFGRLPVLADALEEAGCVGEECHSCRGEGCRVPGWPCSLCDGAGRAPHPLLAHLRSPGPHVRGCHAIDLVLGKE